MKEKIIQVLTKTPGLTGRQIAQSLNLEKRAVNSFLRKNSDGLIQEGWKWYVSGDHVMRIGGPQWVDANIFEFSLGEAGCFSVCESDRCVIQFLEKCKILLIAGARIIALANQTVNAGKSVVLDFNKCPATKHYFDRLGFFDHLDKRVEVLPNRPIHSKAKYYKGNSENLVEIASIDLCNFDYTLPEMLTKAFAHHAGQEYYGAAFLIFSELIGNVQEHSETTIPGFTALQLYGGRRKHIQIVVSDHGLGIAQTLKGNLLQHYPGMYKKLDLTKAESDLFLVERALTKGGLSRFGSDPDDAGRGGGLKRTQAYAAKYDATVTVRQETFQLELDYEQGKLMSSKSVTDLPILRGTQLCFDFFLD